MSDDALSVKVQRLLESVVARYPHQQLDSKQRAELLNDYTLLASRMGYAQFEHALNEARLRSRFIPQPPDISEVEPERVYTNKGTHPVDCAACGGTGWIPEQPVPPARHERYRRCDGKA